MFRFNKSSLGIFMNIWRRKDCHNNCQFAFESNTPCRKNRTRSSLREEELVILMMWCFKNKLHVLYLLHYVIIIIDTYLYLIFLNRTLNKSCFSALSSITVYFYLEYLPFSMNKLTVDYNKSKWYRRSVLVGTFF